MSPLDGIWNSTEKPSHSAKGSRLNKSVPTRRKSFPLRGEWRASAERGKAFPFGESGAQAPREVTIFYKSTMKVSPLAEKAFPFGESGAQAPREVTIFYKSTMKVSPLAEKAFPFGESGAQAPREEKLSPLGRVAHKRRERSLNCTAESFFSTIFRHKKNRRYFHTADLIFITI